jgi:hypothetical protein
MDEHGIPSSVVHFHMDLHGEYSMDTVISEFGLKIVDNYFKEIFHSSHLKHISPKIRVAF